MLYTILRPIARVLFLLIFPYRIIGRENIPTQGGCIITCNHISLLDPVFLGLGVPKRKVHYMAKAEIFKTKIGAWFYRSLGAFPVKRGSKDITAVKTAIDQLQQGHIIGIFPQGKRVKGKKISRYKTGFALMAVRSDCPIVPAYIKTKDQRLRPFRRVTVVFGEPMLAGQLGGIDGQQMAVHLMEETERLADSI